MSAETATTEAVEEVIEAVTESPGKLLGFVAALAGAALATWWVVKRVGIAAQNATDDTGLFDPPPEYAPHPVDPSQFTEDGAAEEEDQAPPEWGDHRPAGAEFMGG